MSSKGARGQGGWFQGWVWVHRLFLSLQQTLPPIKNHPVPNLPAGHLDRRLLLDKEASRVWVKPEPPKPILLHLAVTARSHSTEDFFRNFPSEFPKYFLPW